MLHEHRSPQVDRHGAIPHVDVHVDHVAVATEHVETECRGVVVHDVDRAESFDDGLDHAAHRLLVADVDLERDRSVAKLARRGRRSIARDVGDRNAGSFGDHARCGGQPQTRRARP